MYLGRTVNDLCPVGVIAAYLAVRGRHPGPFFKVVIGTPPSRVALGSTMRAAEGWMHPSMWDTVPNWSCYFGSFS